MQNPLYVPAVGQTREDDIAPLMRRRQILRSVPRVSVVDKEETVLRDSTKMMLAMNRLGKRFYEGTVPAHVKARRRAQNKAARHARRVHRR